MSHSLKQAAYDTRVWSTSITNALLCICTSAQLRDDPFNTNKSEILNTEVMSAVTLPGGLGEALMISIVTPSKGMMTFTGRGKVT